MHIHFDLEFNNPNWSDNLKQESVIILGTIITFLEQRFSVLRDEMENEWKINKSMVVIKTPTEEDNNFGIGYIKFSDGLQSKLESCLSDENYVYLNKLINSYLNP